MWWFAVKRLAECLFIKDLVHVFSSCHSLEEAATLLMNMDELQLMGIIAVTFIVASSVFEILSNFLKFLRNDHDKRQ